MSTTATGNARFLDLLSHLGEIISSSNSLDSILLSTVNMIKAMLDVERCSILILDHSEGVLKMKAGSNIPADEWEKIRVPIGEGISGTVAKTGMPLLVEDSRSSSVAQWLTPRRYDTYSFICVPVRVKSQTIGVINVNNRKEQTPFNREHLDLMCSVGGFMGLAIDNARLFRTTENTRSHLENLVNSLPVAVLTLSLEQRVTGANSRFARLLAIPQDCLCEGKLLREIIPASLLEVLAPMIRETIEFRVDALVETEYAAPYGPLPIEISTCPLTDANGKVDAVLVMLADVSMRREIAELRRVDEMKSNFMSMVSHELRTPLTSIKGAIHLLMNNAQKSFDQQQSELFTIVQNNTERLMRLVNDLLDVVHIENHTFSVIRKPENIKPLIENCISIASAAAARKNIQIRAKLASVTSVVDKDRIQQAVRNLLDNAVKFTMTGGEILVSLDETASFARISIRDTGCGVPEQMRSKLFTRFFQTENTMTRTTGGTGIGLYIAKSIAELHGGSICLGETGPGGSEFIIELPKFSADAS